MSSSGDNSGGGGSARKREQSSARDSFQAEQSLPEHLRPPDTPERCPRDFAAELALSQWDIPPARVAEILAHRASQQKHRTSSDDPFYDDEKDDNPYVVGRHGFGGGKRQKFGDRDKEGHKAEREAENKARRKTIDDEDADDENTGSSAYWSGAITDPPNVTGREPVTSGHKANRRSAVPVNGTPWAGSINQDPGLLSLCDQKAFDHMQAALHAHTGVLIPQHVIIDEIVKHGYVRFVWDELLQGDDERRDVILRDLETWNDVHPAMQSEGRKSHTDLENDSAINQVPLLVTTIHVSQIDAGVTENDLIEVFKKIGPVRGCNLPSGKWYAFVKMENRDDAKRAIRQLHGLKLKSRRIRCVWAKADLVEKTHDHDSAHYPDDRGHAQENKSEAAKTIDEHDAGIAKWMPGLQPEYGGWRDLSAEALGVQLSGIFHLMYMIAARTYIPREDFIVRCQRDNDFANGLLKNILDDLEQPFAMLFKRLVGLVKALKPVQSMTELMFHSGDVGDNQDASSELLGSVKNARANAAKIHGRGRQPADSVSMQHVTDRLIEDREEVRMRERLLQSRLGAQYQRLFRKRRELEDELSFLDTSHKMYDLVHEASIEELEALIEQEKKAIAACEKSYDEREYSSDEYDRDKLLEASENFQHSVAEALRMGTDVDSELVRPFHTKYGRRRPPVTAVEPDVSKLAIDDTLAPGSHQATEFDSSRNSLPYGSSNNTRGGAGGRGGARNYGNRGRNIDHRENQAGGYQSGPRGGNAARGGYRGSSGRQDAGRGSGRRDSRVDNGNWDFDEGTGQSSNFHDPGPRRGNRGGGARNY